MKFGGLWAAPELRLLGCAIVKTPTYQTEAREGAGIDLSPFVGGRAGLADDDAAPIYAPLRLSRRVCALWA